MWSSKKGRGGGEGEEGLIEIVLLGLSTDNAGKLGNTHATVRGEEEEEENEEEGV